MVNPPLLLAFIAAAAVLTITPGVDTAMVLRAAISGRRAASLAAAGIALGCLAWGASVAFGLGALLRASAFAYGAVRLAGAGYLIWLGIRLLARPRQALAVTPETAFPHPFRRGFLTNLLNPKVGVFYITFLPQFIPAGTGIAGATMLLVCLHVLLTLAWFAALIAATAPLGRFLRRRSALRMLDRLTGGIFLAFGLRLAVSAR